MLQKIVIRKGKLLLLSLPFIPSSLLRLSFDQFSLRLDCYRNFGYIELLVYSVVYSILSSMFLMQLIMVNKGVIQKIVFFEGRFHHRSCKEGYQGKKELSFASEPLAAGYSIE